MLSGVSGRACPCINVSKANSVFILNILHRQSVTFHSSGYKWHKNFCVFFFFLQSMHVLFSLYPTPGHC